ncbi:MAG TPA: hypothetical protein VEC16_02890 [Alphaproteobacteria bacterium]|nr:hypothetical protein [Alphaproteobacteria bacterium]
MAASRYLESVPEDHALRLNDEKVAHNLEELHSMIESSGLEVFYMHVNDMSNDVADWTRNVIGYNELADKMKATTDRDEFLKLLSDSINELKTLSAPVVVNVSTLSSVPVAESAKIDMFAPDAVPFPAHNAAPVGNTYISLTQTPSVNVSAPFAENKPASSPVSAPVSAPVAAPITSAAPVSVSVISPAQSVPVAAQSPPVQTAPVTVNISAPISQAAPTAAPIANPPAAPAVVASDPSLTSISAAMSFMNEERFDFEDIFNILLYELEQEVLVLE